MPDVQKQFWWETEDGQTSVLREAMELRDADLRPFNDLRDRLVGPDFAGGGGDEAADKPTNTAFGWFSRYYTVCLGGELEPIIRADPGSPEESMALAYERATVIASQRADTEAALRKVFMDMCCGYGSLLVTAAPSETVHLSEEERRHLKTPLGVLPWDKSNDDKGAIPVPEKPMSDATPVLPTVTYVDPNFVGWDRRARTLEQATYVYVQATYDVLELIRRAEREQEQHGTTRWNLDYLRNVAVGVSETGNQNLGGTRKDRAMTDEHRRWITVTTLMVKNAELEGEERPPHHNWVSWVLHFSDGGHGDGTWVRRGEYLFCPPEGPLQLFAQFHTGKDSLPFSTLGANKTKVEANDRAHGVAYKRIREYKTNPVTDARNAKAAQTVEAAEDSKFVLLPGLDESGFGIQMVTRGGIDQHTFGALQYMDARVAEDLAMDTAGRGAVTGDATATEHEIAAGQSAARGAQFQDAFNESAAGVFRKIAWYIAYSKKFVVRADMPARMTEHARRAMALADRNERDSRVGAQEAARRSIGYIQGGDFLHNPHLDFASLKFEINAQLQRFRSAEQRRVEAAQFRADVAQVFQLAIQMPFFPWVDELRQIENDYGRRGLVEKVDAERLSMMAQAAIEMPNKEALINPGGRPSNEMATQQRQRVNPSRPLGPQGPNAGREPAGAMPDGGA